MKRFLLMVCLLVICGPNGVQAGDSGGPTCPLVGEWELGSVLCGTEDITADVRASVARSTLTVSAAEGGKCRLVLVNADDTCKETEEFEIVLQDGGEATTTGLGVTACKPPACTFGEEDEPCQVGDRKGSWTENVMIEGDRFSRTRTDELAICANWGRSPTKVTWIRKR